MSFTQKMRTLDSRNVVAKISGADPLLKNEYVVYTGHWDHFGVSTPVNGDAIYNGARDNATGTAMLLAFARAFKAVQPAPKRTILLLAVTAEEQGLLGSEYYAKFPLYPLAKTLANLNVDAMNVWGRTKDITVIGLGNSELDTYAREAAAEQGRVLRPDSEPEKGFYYRSDHFNFAKVGVPALNTDPGVDFPDKPADYGQTQARRVHDAGVPPAIRRGEGLVGSVRRGCGRPVAVCRRLSRRQRRPLSGVGARHRVPRGAREGADRSDEIERHPVSSWRRGPGPASSVPWRLP